MWGGAWVVVGGHLEPSERGESEDIISSRIVLLASRLSFLLKKRRGWKGFSNVLYPKNPLGILLKSRY